MHGTTADATMRIGHEAPDDADRNREWLADQRLHLF
jgi:hypothetical protein